MARQESEIAAYLEQLRGIMDGLGGRFIDEVPFRARSMMEDVLGHLGATLGMLEAAEEMLAARIEEQERLEAERREADRARATLLANLPGMAYRCLNDPRWTMEFASEGARALLGYDPAALVDGSTISYAELVHPDDLERVRAEVDRALAERRPFTLSYRVRRADGEVRWVWEQGRAVLGADGEVAALEGLVTDVTEQRAAGERLVASEAYFRAMIERAQDVIAVLEADGTVRFASPSVLPVLGYTPKEVTGRNVFELVHPDDAPRMRELFGEFVATASSRPTDVRFRHRDGRWCILHATGNNLLQEPAVRGVVINAADVTSRREQARALAAEHEVAEILHASATLGEAIPAVLAAIARGMGCEAGTYWCVEEESGLLLCETQWHEPASRPEHIEELNRRFVVLPGVDLPGRAWVRGEPAWVEDLAAATGLPRARAAMADHFLSALALPISAGGQSFGVMEFFSRTRRAADSERLRTAAALGRQIGQFMKRRRAEDALRSREAYFRSITENALDLITVLDAEGIIRYKSPAVTRELGYGQHELDGEDIFGYIHPADVPRAQEVFTRAIERPRTPEVMEIRFRHRNGAWHTLHVVVNSLLDDPAVRGVVANSRDMTNERAAERELREAHATLSALVRLSPSAVIAVDRDFIVRMWNPAAETMFGWSADEVMGQPYPLIAAERGAEQQDLREMLFADGRGLAGIEAQRQHRGGAQLDVYIQSVVLEDEQGSPALAIGLFVDLSERKAVEERVRQAQKMEAVGRLAGGIAHDFNNLLTAIKGNVQLALMDVAPGVRGREEIEQIDQVADRAAALTRQLLAFSRRQVSQARVVDLGGVVRELEPMLRRLIGAAVELRTSADPGAGSVRADPTQMEQVLVNLVVNARDAMPRGGSVEVRVDASEFPHGATEFYPYAAPGTPAVRLTVADTGEGMDASTVEHIFEPFFTTKAMGKGTGLGLSTVYGIVKQSGGYIWVYSEPARGTRFEIYLPRVDGEPVAAAAPPAATPAGGTETILVAEDESSVRELIVRVLTEAGYTVIAAPDGEYALRAAAAHGGPVHLLLTDVVMPRMSGRELASRFGGARVVFMSGYAEDEIARAGVEGLRLLEKPFSPGDLLRMVRVALDE